MDNPLEDCLRFKKKYHFGRIEILEKDDLLLQIYTEPRKSEEKRNFLPNKLKSIQLRQAEIDEENNSTVIYAFHDGAPRTTIVRSSPYLFESFAYNQDFVSTYYNMGFNVVLVPSRGFLYDLKNYEYFNTGHMIENASAAIEWINKQQWSNKRILAIGCSYDGAEALAYAATGDSSVKLVVASSPMGSNFSPDDGNLNTYYQLLSKGGGTNSIGETDEILEKVNKGQGNYKDFIPGNFVSKKKYEKNVNFLVEKLSQSPTPIVFTFGESRDRTSYSTIDYFKRIKHENKFIISHDLGHGNYMEQVLEMIKPYIKAGDILSLFEEDDHPMLNSSASKRLIKEPNFELDEYEKLGDFYAFTRDLKETPLNGTYELSVEFEELSEEHYNKRMVINGLIVVFSKDRALLDVYSMEETSNNKTLFPLEGKLHYKINGNNIKFKNQHNDAYEVFAGFQISAPDGVKEPKVRSAKIKLSTEHP